MTHIIQKRDLLEMLKRFPDEAKIRVRMPYDNVGTIKTFRKKFSSIDSEKTKDLNTLYDMVASFLDDTYDVDSDMVAINGVKHDLNAITIETVEID